MKNYRKRDKQKDRPKIQIPHSSINVVNLDNIQETSRYFQALNSSLTDPSFPVFQNSRSDEVNQYERSLRGSNFSNNMVLKSKGKHDTLFQIFNMVYAKKRILFSLDIEAYEFSHDIVTEIGISIYDPRLHFVENHFKGKCCFQKLHIIIEENMRYRNGKYVKDNRDNFVGGTSFVVPLYQAAISIQILINYYFPESLDSTSASRFGASLVGHDVGGDIKWLTSIGIKFPNYITNDKSLDNVFVIDSQVIWKWSFGSKYSSLGKILRFFDIPNAFLHNGGNDALFTLILILVMCDPNIRSIKNFDKMNQYNLPPEIAILLNNNKVPKDKEEINHSYTVNEDEIIKVGPHTYTHVLNQYAEPSICYQTNIRRNRFIKTASEVIKAIYIV